MARFDDSIRLTGTLIGGVYCVATLLLGLSLLDFLSAIWPFVPGDVGWRYGAMGISSNFVLTPMIGLALWIFTAALARQRRVLKVLGIVTLIIGALVLLGALGFTLDAIQVRRQSAQPAQQVVLISAVKAVIKLLAAMIGFGWLGLGALSQARIQPVGSTPRTQDGPSIVVGG